MVDKFRIIPKVAMANPAYWWIVALNKIFLFRELIMPFNNNLKRLIVRDKDTGVHLPCVMCGVTYPLPDAVHIIDEKEWKEIKGHDSKDNGIPLCPNCHRVFDEVLKPYLYKALKEYGCKDLPKGWANNNKITVTEQNLGLQD
jgi:predicted restriction endonuclease